MIAMDRERVLVAMSGGVDSSTTAAILHRLGYECIGVSMQILPAAESAGKSTYARGCCSLEAIRDAERVAQLIGFPHYVLNFRKEFEDLVIKDFVEEYRKGRTPNPCIRCNTLVKFGTLLERAKKLRCGFVATGHYAMVAWYERSGRHNLLRGKDRRKDQSYALWGLSQGQLSHALFPLGEMEKNEVRSHAAALGLPVACKQESQEICFVPDGEYRDFLKERIPELAVASGPLRDISGKTIGEHRGIFAYTVGQRKGLGLSFRAPLYVIRIDPLENAVYIGRKEDLVRKEFQIRETNWIPWQKPQPVIDATVKIRYQACELSCRVFPTDERHARVELLEPANSVTPGQSAVFYQGELVLGGGIIV